MSPLFAHAVACARHSVLGAARYSVLHVHVMFRYPFVHCRHFGYFHFSAVVNNVAGGVYKHLLKSWLVILLDTYLDVRLLIIQQFCV